MPLLNETRFSETIFHVTLVKNELDQICGTMLTYISLKYLIFVR